MRHTAPLIVVLTLFAGARVARGADEVSAAKALVVELVAANKAKDDSAATAALAKVPDVYKASEDKGERGKLLSAVGKIAKNKKLRSARVAAVKVAVAVEDPKPAWKVVSKVMPDPKKTERAGALDLAAVVAAGELGQGRAVKPLLELAQKAKDDKLAAAAVTALGGFRHDKRLRVKVLEELIHLGVRTRPGQSTTLYISPATKKRWTVVEPALVGALDKLTGRDEGSFDRWEKVYKESKKALSRLFAEDD